MRKWCIFFVALLALPGAAGAQESADVLLTEDTPSPVLPITPVPEATKQSADSKPPGVQWLTLLNHSMRFIVFEHAFRYATEQATSDPDRPFFKGYIDSVTALHGWADGDPFYVNYIGHPMQGAVSGYLWTLSDPRYRYVEFGRNPDYWKSRIRAGAFAWVYSEQMEIGLLSEASLGNIQAPEPQHGFVDHVVTPAIGLGWMIAEDALDQYLVRYVERKTQNRTVRALVRGGANPSRSLANALSGQWPWARPRDHGGEVLSALPHTPSHKVQEQPGNPGVAPFEFTANAYMFAAPIGPCTGGGAEAAFRIHSQWQAVVNVNGCKMTGLEKNLSGDSLNYMAGTRWTPPVSGRLVPYLQVLFGGNKLTQELNFPDQKAALEALAQANGSGPPDQSLYTQHFDVNGFAMAAGMGLDLHFNRALAFRLFEIEYTRSWINPLNGFAAPNGLQVKTGVVLHMGTW